MPIHGHAHKYGDHVDTDVIIPARYLASSDPDELASHCMEDIDADFIKHVAPGDVIVAGRNFGCGSSREHAPLAIKTAGVGAVIAGSFARIFYRNALNIGLPIIESEEAAAGIENGDEVEVDLEGGVIHNRTRRQDYHFPPLTGPAAELVAAGGLRPLVHARLGERG
jgi:3-isopropylmalate dehydratase small subunit